MLSDEIMEKLMPHVKNVIPKQEWHNLGEIFKEVYLMDYDENHDAYVIGYWGSANPLLCFDTKTCSFLGVVMEDYVKEHGMPV